MRRLAAALALLGLSLALGYAVFGERDTAPRARTRAVAPDASRPPEDVPPPVPSAEPAVPDAAAAPAGVDRDQQRALQQALGAEVNARDERIRDLERELDVLKKTLPAPALLHDLEAATVEELAEIAAAAGRVAQERLLAVPEEVVQAHAGFLRLEGTGLARILQRGKYDRLLPVRGGGAYYSFATREHSYDKEPDLRLQQGSYSTSFYGGTFGFLLDLGEIPIENVPPDAGTAPPTLVTEQIERWRFMWSDIPQGGRDRQRAAQKKGKELGLQDIVKAEPGHAYLLRAVLPGEHDILVAFREAARNDSGHTLVWRELKRWDAPR